MLRRDIGMLGFVHKAVLGKCHPGINNLLPRKEPTQYDSHTKPIATPDNVIARHSIYHRSIFGTALIYNRLTQSLVDENTVSKFQARLTSIARLRCVAEDPEWQLSFHSCLTLRPASLP